MNHTEQERVALTDAELDAELEKLAEDVPDMPADFHDRWMQAVRAEAAEKTAPETETEREPEPRGRLVAMRKWTRVLSVAAVFVFLIGGTMIYRNSRKSLEEPAREQAPASAVEAVEAAQAPAAAREAEANKAAEEEISVTAEEETTMAAEEAADMAVYDAAEPMEYAEEASNNHTTVFAAGSAPLKTESKAGEPVSFVSGSHEAAREAEKEEAAEAAEEEEAPLPAATGQPTAEPAPQAEADTAADAGVKENSFFQDMGAFLLLALPYLAVLAVPVIIALVLRHRK